MFQLMDEARIEVGLLAVGVAEELADGDSDKDFYRGRVHSALYFARNILALVEHHAALLQSEDRSVLEIPSTAFASM